MSLLFGAPFSDLATVPIGLSHRPFLRSFSSLRSRISLEMATTLAAAAARRLAAPRLSTQAATLTQRRGLAGSADHHGLPKINFWQDPMSPSQWKEEHFVIVSLSGWGLLFYGGSKLFTGGKKEEKPTEAAH